MHVPLSGFPVRFTARRGIVRRGVLLLAVLAAVTAHATEYVVAATSGLTYSPARLVIIEVDSVRFRNGGGTHNLHADDDRFVRSINCTTHTDPSGNDGSSVAFGEAGTIGDYCEKHGGTGGGMCGTIVVVTERIFVSGFDSPTR